MVEAIDQQRYDVIIRQLCQPGDMVGAIPVTLTQRVKAVAVPGMSAYAGVTEGGGAGGLVKS